MRRGHRLIALLLLALVSLNVWAEEETPQSYSARAETFATKKGITFHLNVGIDVQRWVDTTSDPRMVPGLGVTADYFFSDVFGLFLSLDYVNRGAALGGQSKTASFVDVGLGTVLRYQGNLFSKDSINYLQVGAHFAIPTGDFSGSLISTLPTASKMFMGLLMQGSSIYGIGGGMYLGPVTWLKFGLGNPVSGLTVSRWFTHVGIGLQLTF